MRLLLDEHIDPAIAVALRGRGHDVVAVAEDEVLRGLTDLELADHCRHDRRVIATYDRRDFAVLAEQLEAAGDTLPGILLLSPARYPYGPHGSGALVAALHAFLSAHRSAAALPVAVLWL